MSKDLLKSLGKVSGRFKNVKVMLPTPIISPMDLMALTKRLISY